MPMYNNETEEKTYENYPKYNNQDENRVVCFQKLKPYKTMIRMHFEISLPLPPLAYLNIATCDTKNHT